MTERLLRLAPRPAWSHNLHLCTGTYQRWRERAQPPRLRGHGLHLAAAIEAAGIHRRAPQEVPACRFHAAGPGQLRQLRQMVLDPVCLVLGALVGEEETAEEAFCHGSRVADFL